MLLATLHYNDNIQNDKERHIILLATLQHV